jgi:cyclohexanone monooxygenase
VLIEAQCRYIASALRTMRREGLDTIEVREDVETAWKENADRVLSTSVQNIGGCTTYYLDASGHNATVWPGTMLSMWRSLKDFDGDSYLTTTPSTDVWCPAPTSARPGRPREPG